MRPVFLFSLGVFIIIGYWILFKRFYLTYEISIYFLSYTLYMGCILVWIKMSFIGSYVWKFIPRWWHFWVSLVQVAFLEKIQYCGRALRISGQILVPIFSFNRCPQITAAAALLSICILISLPYWTLKFWNHKPILKPSNSGNSWVLVFYHSYGKIINIW